MIDPNALLLKSLSLARYAPFKLPFIGQIRTKAINGVGVKQKNSGVSDLIIGLPLKKYINRGSETSNWGFTPSLRLPTGSHSGDYPLSDGSWDLGLGLSYSTESFKFYSLYDLFYWYNTEGKRNMREGNVKLASTLIGVFILTTITKQILGCF